MKDSPLRLLLILLLGSFLLWAGRQQPVPKTEVSPDRHPNILFIITDDHRPDGARALGTSDLITPNLDRLIRRGMTFSNTYTAGSDAPNVGAYSRAMLLTGKRGTQLPKNIYLIGNTSADAAPIQTFPQYFRKYGYFTYAVGKWENSRQSFQSSFEGGESLFFGERHQPLEGGHNQPLLHHYDTKGLYKPETRFKALGVSSTLFANAAIKFLKGYGSTKPSETGTTQAKPSSPFLLYVSFTAPHEPRQPAPSWINRYNPRRIRLPANFLAQHPFDNGDLENQDEKQFPRPLVPETIQTEMGKYYASISQVDEQIGRILETLEQNGLADNTLVVWCSANGLSLGEHGLLGKQNLYESSVRVPLVMAGPGLRRNVRSEALCYLHDVFPTLCHLAGLPLPERLDGQSLEGLITGKEKQHRKHVLLRYQSPLQQAVRTADGWKLIQYRVKNQTTEQLFNLRQDPLEIQNLGDQRPFQAQKQKMLNLLSEGTGQ